MKNELPQLKPNYVILDQALCAPNILLPNFSRKKPRHLALVRAARN
jgi:hypothetical protein